VTSPCATSSCSGPTGHPEGDEAARGRRGGVHDRRDGILPVAYRLAPSGELTHDLLARVRQNVDNGADEVMWRAPGTLIAARLMLEWTGDARWRDACEETVEALWARRQHDGFWVQRMYGQEFRGLTPPHGLVGNVQALRPLLDRSRRRRLELDTATVLAPS
jgi:hypothetical protein